LGRELRRRIAGKNNARPHRLPLFDGARQRPHGKTFNQERGAVPELLRFVFRFKYGGRVFRGGGAT
jgi:hypothetical protein